MSSYVQNRYTYPQDFISVIRAVFLIMLLWWPQLLKPQSVPTKKIFAPDVIDHKILMNLSDITRKLSYTVLETTKDAYIGSIDMLFMDRELILVHDRQSNKLLKFNNDGSFAGEFMGIGKGPGEFFEIRSIDGVGNGELLIFKNGQNIDILDYTGKILNTIKLKTTPSLVRWVNPDVIALLYPYPLYFRNEGYEITFIDRKGILLSKNLHHDNKDTGSGVGTYTLCQHNQGSLYYWNPQTDTVYTITSEQEVFPRYIFTHDKRHSDAMKVRTAEYSPTLDRVYIIDGFCEWADFIFLSGANDRLTYRGLLNSRQNICGDVVYHFDKWAAKGLVNDIDGGMSVWPGWIQPDGSLTMAVDAGTLLEWVSHNEETGLKVNPEKSVEFRNEVLSKLTDMSNPVIMRMTR